jgi:hypothetical protein
LYHHPAVCRATSASVSVCESCVCHVVAVWSCVRRCFGSSASRIRNEYVHVYVYVRIRTCMPLCAFEHVFTCTGYMIHIVIVLGMNEWLRGPATCGGALAAKRVRTTWRIMWGCCARALCATHCRKWFGFGCTRFTKVHHSMLAAQKASTHTGSQHPMRTKWHDVYVE